MDGAYDEIISENPFYIELTKQYSSLYQHCVSQSWIICVPRIGSLNTRVFTIEDFCAHILVPNDELPETHYSTLTEKQVTVLNKVVTLEVAKGLPLQSHILFEELFYTEDHMKYKVWCIETPLQHSANRSDIVIGNERLSSVNDCIDLLWSQAAGRQILDQIEHNVDNYVKRNRNLPMAMAPLKNSVGDLYTQCLQVALQNRRLREKSKTCKQTLDNIKLAVETYMQHLLFPTIFKPICTCSAYEDSHLNKKIRNLSDIQLKDLDIKKDLYHAVPKAKQILSKINNYATVLEKVICIKRALNAIKKTDNDDDGIILLTADDILPVFVFLVIKSGLPNWYSQLIYMKEFRFSGIARGSGDECAFLITTLEAVVEHIESGALTGPPNPESFYHESDLTEDRIQPVNRKGSLTESVSTSDANIAEETLEYIFDLIKASHKEQVFAILERNQKHLSAIQQDHKFDFALDICGSEDDEDEVDNEIYTRLCHPLCNCKKCNKKVSRNLLKSSPTVMSRDSHGLTPLHIACIHGKANIVEALLEIGAELNATDLNECTPLHYAASRGHQNALLLLLHNGANMNSVNIDKNTPLHLSANNGHLNCVKALIYYAEHSRMNLNINCFNESGNTPLHMASKWGYEGLAKILIEHGAEPSIQNQYNKSAFDYAHNLRILRILKSCTPNLYEYIHITNIDGTSLNVKSDNSSSVLEVNVDNSVDVSNVTRTVDNLKRIDRVLKAISYGDVKLACFYMNIDYNANDVLENNAKTSCHPLCVCYQCKRKNSFSDDFDINFTDTHGHTALHYAARYGLDEMCSILLINNAYVNSVNKKGETPLHLAALNNKTTSIYLLIDKGANINAINLSGSTALHYACQMGNIGAVKVLLSYNPDVTILNGTNKTPLDIGKDKVYLTIIDLIEKHTVKI